MAEVINYRFRLRRGLAASWTTKNEVLLEGEFGLELDTRKVKLGDGVTAWNSLSYFQPINPRSGVAALSISTGAVVIDCSLGNYFTLVLTENVTSITFTNLPAAGYAQSIWVRIKQDATGGRTVALPTAFKASTGSAAGVTSSANAYTLLAATTVDQGTRWEYTLQGAAA